MKLNKKKIATIFLFVVLIVFIEYQPLKLDKFELPSKAIHNLDQELFNIHNTQYATNIDFNRYWGFAIDKIDIKVEEEVLFNITQPDGENILCIKSSCYRLLGIYHDKEKSVITLYNQKLKEKVKDYTTTDILESKIKIDNISANKVYLKEINGTREWKFKIFDVNQTKYIPKDIEL